MSRRTRDLCAAVAALVVVAAVRELFLAYVALLGLSLWSLVSSLLDPRPRLVREGDREPGLG